MKNSKMVKWAHRAVRLVNGPMSLKTFVRSLAKMAGIKPELARAAKEWLAS